MMSTGTYRAMFERVVQRAPLATEITRLNPEMTVQALADDIAASSAAQAEPATVVRLYEAAFGRKPDAAGLDYWSDMLREKPGFGEADLAAQLAGSAEFKARFAVNGTIDRGVLVETLYETVLGREPEAGGHAFWAGGALSPAQLLHAFADSAEYARRADQPLRGFLAELALTGSSDPTGTDADDMRGSIFDGQRSAAAATGAVIAGRDGSPTLEDPFAGADVIKGTSGSDTIDGRGGHDVIDGGGDAGRVTFAGASPLSLRGLVIGDRLTGGAGADSFRYSAGSGGVDLILDFDPVQDQLLIGGSGRYKPFIATYNYGQDALADTLIVFVDTQAGAGSRPIDNAAIILVGVTGQSIAELAELKPTFDI